MDPKLGVKGTIKTEIKPGTWNTWWYPTKIKWLSLDWEVTGVPTGRVKSVTVTYEGYGSQGRIFSMEEISFHTSGGANFLIQEEELDVRVTAEINTWDGMFVQEIRGTVGEDKNFLRVE